MPIIGAEDEDFENEMFVEEKCLAFDTVETLKGRPTHLLVFLQHVILQFDCAPLLCYLHAELFKSHNSKETKKYFVEFYNNFLDKGAVLRVTVPANILSELERTRADLSEEQQKQCALEIQEHLATEVAKQLEDFKQKRKMGMTPNEAELLDVENHYPTDRVPIEMKEKSVAENLLDKMAESQSNIVSDEEKCQSIFQAVAFYMKHLGVKTKPVDSKKSRGGFFRRPLKPSKKDDVPKTKIRGSTFIPDWMNRNIEVKPKTDAEADKEKDNPQRKGAASSKGPQIDPAVPFSSIKKPSSSGGSASLAGSELSEGAGVNMATANSPESINSDGPCSDPLPPSEGGEVFVTVPTIGESVCPETPTEENPEKDSVDGLFVAEPVASPTSPPPQLEEMDPRLVELEKDPPNWRDSATPDTLKHLSKKETKRQEVINELFATEHAHVRMLYVLQTVFSKPMEREDIFNVDELGAIFPGLDEIIDMHYAFYENLKTLREENNFIVKSIGPTLTNRFGGAEGDWFQKLTARFCSHQSWGLDQIKSRQKKDPRCNSFILEAEAKPQCRRLQLKDIIPMVMQRVTKYPLLLENIAKNTEDQEEKEIVQQSAEYCRKILNHVNEEVKVMENLLTLKDYQRRLDTSGLRPSNELYTEYKNIDLTQRTMLFEAPLTWRVTKEKAIEVQCVLLADLLVLLQRQDDKMVLKCQSKSNITLQETGRQMLSPIIKLDSVFLREVATDRKAFYVIFTWDSGAQIYELVAQSIQECKGWTDVIKKAVDDLKKSGLHQKLPLPPGGGPPLSPSALSAPLSPTENGGLKSTSDRDKDSLTDDNSTNTRHLLIDYLSEKGFDLIGHTNSDQEKVANCALDEVMSLKRLLVTSISLSDDFQLDENGGEGPGRTDQDTDGCQSTERQSGDTSTGADNIADGMDDGGISTPLVLSKERMEEVRKRLQSLEEQLTRLQTVEEAHHRLQEALSKFSLEGGNLQ